MIGSDLLFQSIELACVAAIGASIGSFLNVCIYRIPIGLTVVQPKRSFCPSCHTQVKAIDNLITPRTGHTATTLSDGRILVTGGRDADGHLVAGSEIFDPETQTSSASAALHTARVDHSATVLADGRVPVAGGTGASGALSSAEIFDPVHPENVFSEISPC